MKTIIIGFDAFDPVIFERLHSEGKTPNLSHFVNHGSYSRLGVSNPPQSEVSWTSIATGLNPGGHGIFDFVHRNPKSYGSQVSLLPTKNSVLGRQFIPPHSSTTIFDVAVEDGYPGISLWWPASFPARLESPVWSIPGLGTPDIFGRLGVGIFYSLENPSKDGNKTRVEPLTKLSDGSFVGEIEGPIKTTLTGTKTTKLSLRLNIINEHYAQLIIGEKKIDLKTGQWSPFIELTFRVGFGFSIKTVTRAVLSISKNSPSIYFLPLQIHPLKSPWPYGTPKKLLKGIWQDLGPYLTLGWPQDTTGLEERYITDEQFLTLCDSICAYRERTLLYLLDSFKEGVLACVFDSLDRIQHMFLRDRIDIIESWYLKLDALLGRLYQKINENKNLKDAHVLVVSDHGFGDFKYRVHLNRWLIDNEYLVSKASEDSEDLGHVEWQNSKAYAIGLNSLYLNLSGREAEGLVPTDMKFEIGEGIRQHLLNWKGPDGQQVVSDIWRNEDIFCGPYAEYGPDFVVGYTPGYRASAQTGLGEWGEQVIELNEDHWGADHCFGSKDVPGVIFSNISIGNFPKPTFADFPLIALGKEIKHKSKDIDPHFTDEDQQTVNERLKELGYL